MNKQELIDKLKTRFYAVNDTDIYEGNTEAGVSVYSTKSAVESMKNIENAGIQTRTAIAEINRTLLDRLT